MKNFLCLLLGLIIGALIMYFLCCRDIGTIEPPTSPVAPKGLITTTEAQGLNDNWTDLRKNVNNAVAQDSIDNRSSWFAIKEVREYLDYVQYNNEDVTGVRLYLGVHGNLKEGGRTTIFMIPTIPSPDRKTGGDPNTDAPEGNGLNRGDDGMPPGSDYPN